MATRSLVCANGKAVYIHYDGYPSHHMPILTNLYNTPEAVELLMGKMAYIAYRELSDTLEGQVADSNILDTDDEEPIKVNNLYQAKSQAINSGCDFVYFLDKNAQKWHYCEIFGKEDLLLKIEDISI